MTVLGSGHPLDVDLAAFVEPMLDATWAAGVEAHLADCFVCRTKVRRLSGAARPELAGDGPLSSAAFPVPSGEAGGDPAMSEIWLAGASDDRLLVLVLRLHGDRFLAAPVTFDVEAADDETLLVAAEHSPLQTGLAIHPELATELPRSVLLERIGSLATGLDGLRRGSPIVDASDPRLELRQCLADRLGSMEEQSPDPGTGADAPPPGPHQRRSSLIADVRAMRGDTCAVRAMYEWEGVLLAHGAGWDPIAIVDELGVVLVVLDTPHGLADDRDFHTARSVLTRFNGTALVVLAGAVSDVADVFDSASLNYGIDTPSGRHTPPRPLISGLSPFDAIAKFLDQITGARQSAPPSRGPVTRVDVGEILREAAAAAIAETVRQGSRFRIAPKRRGYESVADADEPFQAALALAFGTDSVVEDLLRLAPRTQS